MKIEDAIKAVEKLDVWEKAKLYGNYCIAMIALQNSFDVIDLDNQSNGFGKPDKKFKGIGFFYLWKDTVIKSYDEFCSLSNITKNVVNCEDWKEKGFASRSWTVVDPNSIYNYVTPSPL